MTHWLSNVDQSRPCWNDYRSLLQQLDGPRFPSADALSRLLPAGLTNQQGEAIHFVAAGELPAGGYEHRIYATGAVSTREACWHDLFNALVWSRFPRLKSAMNTLHVHEQLTQESTVRGMLRDTLTLLDESGAIVVSADDGLLEAVARRDWAGVFQSGAFLPAHAGGGQGLNIFLCGHALLEKFLRPYKAITAQVLLIRLSQDEVAQSRESLRTRLDQQVADGLLTGALAKSPADLSPLPVMGIPGWWPGHQDELFYADQKVFRPPPDDLQPAPVFHL